MIEIERKFLVLSEKLPDLTSFKKCALKQGYITSSDENTVRIRILDDDAILTIKGKTIGLTRAEFEYPVAKEHGHEMLKLCDSRLIEKTRYFIPQEKHTWELDYFSGKLEGLVLAEIELDSEDEAIELPNWIGSEVSQDARYFNSNLSKLSGEAAANLVRSNIAG